MPKTKVDVPRRGVIYARQSRTKDGSESLATQERIGRETCERFGIEIVEVLVEPPSTSGYKRRGRERPRFLELLELVAAGDVNTVVASRLDRLSRGGGPGWAPLLDAAEGAGLDVDHFVLTPSGFVSEFEIGIRASMDREESRKRSEQILELKERHAEAGRPSGGGARPFGYAPDKVTVIAHEAAMLRDAADWLLAGESLNGICRRWNEAGTLTGNGAPWRGATLRNMLLNARLAGLREHRGEIVGDASWPAILDRSTWEAVRALLTDPARRTNGSTRGSLLYGIARCGREGCGAKLNVAPNQGRPSYRCQKTPGKPGCGGLGIVAAPFEAVVVEAMLERLDTKKLRDVTRDRGAELEQRQAVDDVLELEAKLEELAKMWAEGEITRPEWIAARKPVEARLEVARRLVSRTPRGRALDGLEGPGKLRAAWEADELSHERKRAILAAVIDRIVVAPARIGLNRFDDDRLDIVWSV